MLRELKQTLLLTRDKFALAMLERATCDATRLRSRPVDLESNDKEWSEIERATRFYGDCYGAVNSGDRRAIYTLTRNLPARSVLEIGTWSGASTAMFALGLKANAGNRLVSVDIENVNAAVGPWSRLGLPQSPVRSLEILGCGAEFVVSQSLRYLKNCTERFDLIFLDGSHAATAVYREIPLALQLLNDGGTILLHDVYPDLRPLWADGVVIHGPFLALERFAREQAPFQAHPLGALAWPTKQDSNITSLAVLGRRLSGADASA